MTFIKIAKSKSLCSAFLLGTALFSTGCDKQPIQSDRSWSGPLSVAASKDGLVGGVAMYKWHDTIIMLQGRDDESARCFLMNSNDDRSHSWAEVPLSGVPHGYLWAYPALDQVSDSVFFELGYIENEQLLMNVFAGRITGKLSVQDAVERKWKTETRDIFGEAHTNVRLTEFNEPGKRHWPSLGLGIINGSSMDIPFCLEGFTFANGTAIARGPYCNGVFHSEDSGAHWQTERISDADASTPSLCKTKHYYYDIAVTDHQRDLSFSRKATESGSWQPSKVITTTYCDSALYWKYVAIAADDTIHLCWLDRRHEKTRFSMEDPNRGNYEVAYCHRKDTDSSWSKDMIISISLFYCYSPAMAVEGDNIVIVWAGSPTVKDWHNIQSPNDIYFVTSKDAGKSWAKPLNVTDLATNGITSGEPQVMLLNGVIHLFYIQGKMDLQQMSPGLTKLNQPPWPIYYVERPFPD